MDFADFQKTLSAPSPPAGTSVYLQALWYDAQGQWEQGHELIQDVPDQNASWIHAYFHRKEGDLWNADYWYRRAGKKRPSVSLQEEWEALVRTFL
ncbi:hypothetical protein ACFSC6_04645 [Rufibacter sediminis]|uniref:Uncharacterized protein n=1 Tax=Rufibacter sediminis TaxID=2762756 RepID=A0ABR6VS26_9BACT|nr:hypothetical protein [Rufibacter sediminis]MBC3539989.1 hypothetical protein [Rufibacter sediminis]